MCAGFLAANPYALLDRHTFWDGIQKQTETAGEDGGKLGLANTSGWRYYLGTFTWGFGWLPSLAALGGVGALLARHRRLALLLAPAPVLLFLYLGEQSRFFARWMLPVYPILCLLAAWGRSRSSSRVRLRLLAAGALAALCSPRASVFSVHNDLVLARADTRMVAREWMEQQHRGRDEDRHGADRAGSVGGGRRRAAVPVHRQRQPLEQVAHVALVLLQRQDGRAGQCPVVKLEDYERTTRPELIASYERGGFCWVVTGSTQFGRAYADPDEVPHALATTRRCARAARWSTASARTATEASRSRSTTRSTPTRWRMSGRGRRS